GFARTHRRGTDTAEHDPRFLNRILSFFQCELNRNANRWLVDHRAAGKANVLDTGAWPTRRQNHVRKDFIVSEACRIKVKEQVFDGNRAPSVWSDDSPFAV